MPENCFSVDANGEFDMQVKRHVILEYFWYINMNILCGMAQFRML